jgi:hypothetical protein
LLGYTARIGTKERSEAIISDRIASFRRWAGDAFLSALTMGQPWTLCAIPLLYFCSSLLFGHASVQSFGIAVLEVGPPAAMNLQGVASKQSFANPACRVAVFVT